MPAFEPARRLYPLEQGEDLNTRTHQGVGLGLTQGGGGWVIQPM